MRRIEAARVAAFASLLFTDTFPRQLMAQRAVTLSPNRFDVTLNADLSLAGPVGAAAASLDSFLNGVAEAVPFHALPSTTTLPPNGPRFLIVAPANGTTPANVALGLDPDVVPFLRPGVYSAAFTYRLDLPGDDTRGAGGFFALRITAPPPPTISSVVNAATVQPFMAPGSAASILGTNLASPVRFVKSDLFAVHPTNAGNTTVTFNGIAAPLTFADRTRIGAIVPRELAGQSSARVVVEHFSQSSAEFVVPLQDTAPGVFTRSEDGNGQGDILQTTRLNSFSTSPNSVDNPVEKGASIVVFATGAGVRNQDVRAGQILLFPQWPPMIRPKAPISLNIGGKRAQILYAGGAPLKVGWIQVNVLVPQDVDSGEQIVELMIGDNTNAAQQRVTVAIQ